MPDWKVKPAKDDAGYFEHLSKTMFTAGLSWQMVEKKWPGFVRAFASFSPSKVSEFSDARVKKLMGDTGIVRNERKIRATVHNAGVFLELGKEYGSFQKYLQSFGKDEKLLQEDLQERFHHVGSSTARMFLWSVGYPLTPTAEEKKWMSSHKM